MLTVVHDPMTASPNLSLNCHSTFSRRGLYLGAVIGTILQVGVLLFSGFITYHPNLKSRFQKEGDSVDDYAYPLVAIGTSMLVVGAFVCACVIEGSTEERHYSPSKEYDAYVVWLQRKNVVNDQVFRPCAIYPSSKRRYVTTSSRSREIRQGDLDNPDTGVDEKEQTETPVLPESPSLALENLTVSVTVVCLVGFILQFIGLRGMNWSASVAQLVAILIMTVYRAWVRRGLAEIPRYNLLPSGFELEWFSLSLLELLEAKWLNPEPPIGPRKHSDTSFRHVKARGPRQTRAVATEDLQNSAFNGSHASSYTRKTHPGGLSDQWIVVTGRDQEYEPVRSASTLSDVNDTTPAQEALNARVHLGNLVDWKSPVSAEALRLTEAIEAVLESFMSLVGPALDDEESFIWPVPVDHFTGKDKVYLRLAWKNGIWRAHAGEIEAVLSLWVYSIRSRSGMIGDRCKSKRSSDPFSGNDADGDGRVRATAQQEGPGFRILCSSSQEERLNYDIQWWIPKALRGPEVRKIDKAALTEVSTARLMGYGASAAALNGCPPVTSSSRLYKSSSSDDLAGPSPSLPQTESHSQVQYLALETYDSLGRMCAKDLFFSFIRAVVKDPRAGLTSTTTKISNKNSIKDRLPDIPLENGNSASIWEHLQLEMDNFALQNQELSDLAQRLHRRGFWTTHEAYFDLIAALSLEQRLPEDYLLVDHAQDAIQDLEEYAVADYHSNSRFIHRREYYCISSIHIWLLDRVVTFDQHRKAITPRALAFTLQYLHALNTGIDLAQKELRFHDIKRFRLGHEEIVSYLSVKADQWPILRQLIQLLVAQGHQWDLDPLMDFGPNLSLDYPLSFKLTRDLDYFSRRRS